jgi:protein-tyrosine-phosphatase
MKRMKRQPDVLFVCVHNAGRSQMAKALFNWIAEERGLKLWADSAGTLSSDRVHPEVVTVMGELGIDISGEKPKLLTDDMLAGDPRVFTMGCAVDSEACPSLRLERVTDWGLPDPKGRPLGEVRAIRDEIKRRVVAVLDEVAGA